MEPAFRFLDLPAELRNKIYYYTLKLCIEDNLTRGSVHEPSLRHTCKQICAETEKVYLHALDTEIDREDYEIDQLNLRRRAFCRKLVHLREDVRAGIAEAEDALEEHTRDGEWVLETWHAVDERKKRKKLLNLMLAHAVAFE